MVNTSTGGMYDCIVVGAGVEGSASAYQVAKAGKRTLLIEQFKLRHSDGSSHGLSRLTRRGQDEFCFSQLMADAHAEWKELEQLTNQQIYVKTGVVQVVNKRVDLHEKSLKWMTKLKAPYKLLDPTTSLKEKFPHLKFSENYKVIFDEDGGFIKADKGLAALQDMYIKFGGEVIDECKVLKIDPGSEIVIETSLGKFTAKSVILCMGTWAANFFENNLNLHLPYTPLRVHFAYWNVNKGIDLTLEHGTPSFIDLDVDFYGFPASVDYSGLIKICVHGGSPYDITDGPSTTQDENPHKLNELRNYIKEHFVGVEATEPAKMGTCKYSMTPDEKFILDRHPEFPNIVFGAGFSGAGFKFAPVIGIILRDLALGNQQQYDISDYSLIRFKRE
ncbi:hypothetical protein CHUAL_013686 [Chamberlinius hualienensis]